MSKQKPIVIYRESLGRTDIDLEKYVYLGEEETLYRSAFLGLGIRVRLRREVRKIARDAEADFAVIISRKVWGSGLIQKSGYYFDLYKIK